MAKYAHDRLRNTGVKLYFKFDDTQTAYTEQGAGSDYTSTDGGTTGDGMAYENEGHAYPTPQTRTGTVRFQFRLKFDQPRPALAVHDIVHIVRVDSDANGEHRLVLITGITQNRAGNGLPSWEGTAEDLEDPTQIARAGLLAFLGLTGSITLDPVKNTWAITTGP